MSRSRKVNITCVPIGYIFTRSLPSHLPVTADEMVNATITATKAGAAILHLRVRDPFDGRSTQAPVFCTLLQKIKANTNAVINLTMRSIPT